MASSNKKLLGIIAGIAALIAVGGYIGKTYYEQKMVKDIRSAMASVPAPYYLEADTVTVEAFSRSATITGVRGGMKSPEGDLEGTVERADVTGLNLSAFRKGQGNVQAAKTLTLRNTASKGLGIAGSVKLYELEDIKGDFARIYEEWAKAYPAYAEFSKTLGSGKDAAAQSEAARNVKVFAGLVEALETMHIGRVKVEGYAIAMPFGGRTLSMNMESSEMRGYSLRRLGPGNLRNLTAALDGEAVFSLKECALDGAELPNYAKMLREMEDPAVSRDPSKLLLADPIAVKKLRLTDMKVLKGPLPLSIAAINYDMNLGAKGESLSLVLDVREADMNRSDLLALSPELAAVQNSLPERLSLGAGVDCYVKKQDNGSADVSVKKLELSGKSMGRFFMAGDVSGVRTKRPGSALVHGAMFSLADNGIVDMVFTMQTLGSDADPKAVRQQRAGQVEAQRAAFSDPSLQKLNADITAFLRQPGGTLAFNLNPQQPLSVTALQMAVMANPASLGITSSFTPGK